MEDEGLEKLLIHNFIKKDPNNVKFFFKYITGRIDIKNIGGAPKYENANTKQIMRQLAQMSVFDSIFG